MRNGRWVLSVGGVFLLLLLAFSFIPDGRCERRLSIATASRLGNYYPLGNRLARILERMPDSEVEQAWAWTTIGSVENVRLLTAPAYAYDDKPENERAGREDSADLAFVNVPALRALTDDQRAGIRALAPLQYDVIQVVVRRSSGIRELADLDGRRVYVGGDSSGTKLIADQLLTAAGVTVDRAGTEAIGYGPASQRLLTGDLDAAFFASGTPCLAVEKAMAGGGCALLAMSPENMPGMEAGLKSDYEGFRVPANFYPNQPREVPTLMTRAILCCRADLSEDAAVLVLNAIFGNITDLLRGYAELKGIRYEEPTDWGNTHVKAHPGVARFWAREREKLLIATGSITGRYYRTGKVIERLLEQRGVPARAINTDGSVENARLLAGDRRVLAIMQYDVALTSYWDDPDLIYPKDIVGPDEIAPVRDMRRIATLHEEKVHIVARKDALRSCGVVEPASPDEVLIPPAPEAGVRTLPLLDELQGKIVAIGPEGSGTQLAARSILKISRIEVDERYLSLPDTVARLRGGAIQAAFFVGGVPSHALKSVLQSEGFSLVGLRTEAFSEMGRPGVSMATIPRGEYVCVPPGCPDGVPTLATMAVLVTTADLDHVATITEALCSGSDLLVQDGGVKALALALDGVPLHPDAEEVYREKGILPADPTTDWLGIVWRSLACLVMLVGAYKGIHHVRRDATSNRFGREILDVPVDADTLDSVRRLERIQGEIKDRVRRRWWSPSDLDRARWARLDDLIERRKTMAKSHLLRALLGRAGELAAVRDSEALRGLSERGWCHVADGELDPAQNSLLKERIAKALGSGKG